MSARHKQSWSRRRKVTIGACAAAVVIAGSVAVGAHAVADAAPTHPPTKQLSAGDAGKLQDPVADPAPAKTGTVIATRVRIPSIHVDSSLIGLDLKPGTNQLKAPLDFSRAGWYKYGTVPGNIGPAVIDGHVDSPTAPGIFIHLNRLRPGDRIYVSLSNHTVKTFAVTKSIAAAKTAFPTTAVYGPTPDAQLRVITCDGIFDPATGHYVDNLVVFATLED